VPAFVIHLGQSARYLRIRPRTTREFTAFQKIEVFGQAPAEAVEVQLRRANVDEDRSDELVVCTAAGQLVAIDRDGNRLWDADLPASVLAWACVDLETDGRQDILAYTTEDACYALSSDGFLRWRADIWAQYVRDNPDTWDRSWCPYSLACLTAWRPHPGSGLKEVVGFGHTTLSTITPDGDISHQGGMSSEKAVAADSSVLDREVLVTTGWRFSVRDAESGNFMTSQAMKGKLSGNGLLPVFSCIAPVTNEGCAGFLGINGSSLHWAPAENLNGGWGEATDVPIVGCTLTDVDGDACPEAVVGFEDGYLRAYDLQTGAVLGKASVGSQITAVDGWGGSRIAVATPSVVYVLNRELHVIAQIPGEVTSMAALKGDENLLCVADQRGVVSCYAANPIDRRTKTLISPDQTGTKPGP
jgi:hypothetical protein